jgi:hypothetical protein
MLIKMLYIWGQGLNFILPAIQVGDEVGKGFNYLFKK